MVRKRRRTTSVIEKIKNSNNYNIVIVKLYIPQLLKMHCPFCKKWMERQKKNNNCPDCIKLLLRCDECYNIIAVTFRFCTKCGKNVERIIRVNRAKVQKNILKQKLLSKPKHVSTMPSSSSEETFCELNLSAEDIQDIQVIEDSQKPNIKNVLVDIDVIEDSQQLNIDNVLIESDLSESPSTSTILSCPGEPSGSQVDGAKLMEIKSY